MAITPAHDPQYVTAAPPVRDGLHRLFTWSVWAAQLAATLYLVWHYGAHVPMMDDFAYVIPGLYGDQALRLSWVYEYYADNLFPIAKLTSVGLMLATDYHWPAPAYFNVLALAAIAAAFIVTARRLRGRASFTDAVFPLVLLGWGQWENLHWGNMLPYVLAAALVFAVLLLIVRYRDIPFGPAVLASVLVVLCTIGGPSSLAYVPALVLWLGWVAFATWRRGGPGAGTKAAILAALAAAAVAMIGVFFYFHKRDTDTPDTGDLRTALLGLYQILGMALTTEHVSLLRPLAGWPELWVPVSGVVLALLTASLVLLVTVWVRQPAERSRTLGLLLVSGGALVLFYMLGRARIAAGPLFMTPRYAIFAMPLVCGLYCAWVCYGSALCGKLVPAVVFAAAVLLAPWNFYHGWLAVYSVRVGLDAFMADLEAGMPHYRLVEKHFPTLLPPKGDPLHDTLLKDHLLDLFRGMRDAGIPPFDALAPDEVLVLPRPSEPRGLRWGQLVSGTGRGTHVEYRLARPTFVAAVGVRYSFTSKSGQVGAGRIAWRDSRKAKFSDRARGASVRLVSQPLDKEDYVSYRAWVLVNDTIDELRIQPAAGPFDFRAEELILVVPR